MSFRNYSAEFWLTTDKGFSLEGVFSNEVLKNYFVMFLTKSFQVEEFLFVVEVSLDCNTITFSYAKRKLQYLKVGQDRLSFLVRNLYRKELSWNFP